MNPLKTVWVTGAASGIGAKLASSFYEKGYQLIASDINFEGLKKNASLWKDDKRVLIEGQDIRSYEEWKRISQAAVSKFGKIDMLFNVSGVVTPGFLLEAKIEDVSRHLDVNAKGTIYGTRVVAEIMKSQGQGHIVNIASLAGVSPLPGMSYYSASKFAVRGFSLSVSQELKKEGISVTVICPDLVKTPMLDLQLSYEKESALVFSGPKPLTTEDIERVIFETVIPKRPLEVCLPRSRGVMAKLASFLPALVFKLEPLIAGIGRAHHQKLKKEMEKSS